METEGRKRQCVCVCVCERQSIRGTYLSNTEHQTLLALEELCMASVTLKQSSCDRFQTPQERSSLVGMEGWRGLRRPAVPR